MQKSIFLWYVTILTTSNSFQNQKETHEKEKKAFLEWATSLWTSNHCVRALRPKPTTEMVYEAEFKMRANEMASFPKRYEMAALIPFDNNQNRCEIVFQKNLIKVNNPYIKIYYICISYFLRHQSNQWYVLTPGLCRSLILDYCIFIFDIFVFVTIRH